MKNKKLITMLGFTTLLTTVGFAITQSRTPPIDLNLTVTASKDTFILGEPISLRVELQNLSGKKLLLANTFDPEYGSLTIYARPTGQKAYTKFMNPKWGILETNSSITIGENKRIANNLSVLYRLDEKDVPHFFFTTPGDYEIKISYQVKYPNVEKMKTIESDFMRITVLEPSGDDLELWNEIKDTGEFAYFLQKGDFHVPSYKTKDREHLRLQVDQILEKHPNSYLSEGFRQSLRSLHESSRKMQEYLEKVQKHPPD